MRIHASDGERLFRFSRILDGPSERQLADDVLLELATAMSAGGNSDDSDVPAGFTYLGQFIAHDLSFSEGRPELGVPMLKRELVLGRSPALDLDSLYGDGPEDQEAEGSYEADRVHLRVGSTTAAAGFGELPGHDLPRHDAPGKERQALHPGHAQRRERRGRADASCADPLPQPRRRRADRRSAGQRTASPPPARSSRSTTSG